MRHYDYVVHGCIDSRGSIPSQYTVYPLKEVAFRKSKCHDWKDYNGCMTEVYGRVTIYGRSTLSTVLSRHYELRCE